MQMDGGYLQDAGMLERSSGCRFRSAARSTPAIARRLARRSRRSRRIRPAAIFGREPREAWQTLQRELDSTVGLGG